MAHSMPAPATYSLRPLAPESAPWPNRAVKKLVRMSSALRAPFRRRRDAPSLAEQLTHDYNQYGTQVLEFVEGSARGFRRVFVDEFRSELMCSALLPGSRLATFELPRALANRSYPAYYLEPYHGQHNGYLSAASATSCDAIMEWLFDGELASLRYAAAEALGRVDHGTVVDLGMGTGAFLRHLKVVHPNAKVVGVDLSPYMLGLFHAKHAEGLTNVEVLEGDLTATGLPGGSADGVTLTFVLHELPPSEVKRALREAHRLLKENGRLVILDGISPREMNGRLRQSVAQRLVHEPYAAQFAKLNLAQMLSELGFGPLETRTMAGGVALRSCAKRC